MEETVEIKFRRECSLCAKIFTDPRILPCLHTFCLKCLENTGQIKPEDQLPCPVCGTAFTVPEKGLIDLPKNFLADKSADMRTTCGYIVSEKPLCSLCTMADFGDRNVAEKYCIICENELCRTCCTKHEKQKDHLIVDLNSQEESKKEEEETCRCRVHQEETPKLFCTFCKKIICDKCFHESHSSHSCSDVTDVGSLVCKWAEKEYNIFETMQLEFQERRETLHREQMKFLEKVKTMETEIGKRCEEIKELVVKETKALLQELAVLKKERLEEIEMEQRRLDKHAFTLKKFKEYCAWIKSNGAHIYTCEAECLLRNTADNLKTQQKKRIENRIFPLKFRLQIAEIEQLFMPISNAIGKINVICPYKMELPTVIDTNERTVHGMASLRDKLYLLSDSILIHRAENPYDCVSEIKTPDIKSPASIVSCSQTSRLYIYDKGNACIWKVSIPDHQVTRWFDKVKEPCAMSVTPNGEILMTTRTADTKQPITVEVYDKNAILTERIELPKNIRSLERIYKTPSGNYIGFGEQNLYKFRADGSIVCQSDVSKYPESGNCVRRLEVSPYHVFLISSSQKELWGSKVSLISLDLAQKELWGSKVSLISLDLAFHRNLLTGIKDKHPINLCYVKATKRLAVLEQVQVRRGQTLETKGVVTVYDVL